MKMEVYTVDEIINAVDMLERVQDALEVEDHDILYDMLQEVIGILCYEEGGE
jgi:hypothetical protein